jgi:hypothetical protein
LAEAPCRRACAASPSTGSKEGFDKLGPNGWVWRMLRFIANQVSS